MSLHLNFYIKCFEAGEMPFYGLCRAADEAAIDEEILSLFEPTKADIDQLVSEGELFAWPRDGFWASGVRLGHGARNNGFTTLRQTIVLFMAAINNEL